jgi:hypothetical protein
MGATPTEPCQPWRVAVVSQLRSTTKGGVALLQLLPASIKQWPLTDELRLLGREGTSDRSRRNLAVHALPATTGVAMMI